jgi:hypothetical protein
MGVLDHAGPGKRSKENRMIILDPPDACPSLDCHPGIPDPALPAGPAENADGGTLASYECSACGVVWSTWFDEWGWPVARMVAAAPGDAAARRVA